MNVTIFGARALKEIKITRMGFQTHLSTILTEEKKHQKYRGTEKRPWEDTARRQTSASQGKGPQKKPNMQAP